jgi:hypothetical protein
MTEPQEPKPAVFAQPVTGEQGPRQKPTMQHDPSQSAPVPAPLDSPQRIPYWLQQAEKFLRVIVRLYLGLLVCIAPWYPPAWDANPLFMSSPWLLDFITHGAVRGMVSGLGLLNLYIALRDAIRIPSNQNSR